MFKVFLTYVLIFNSVQFANAGPGNFLLSPQFVKSGPGNTGGGDPRSQELFAMIKTIPATLAAKGAHFFQEINLDELNDFITQMPIQVELEKSIMVEGKPKMSKCFAANGIYKISLDPEMWDQVGSQSNSELTKRAQAFHEVLCLMGKEKNNDYSISSKLLQIESLAMVGIKATKNQIVPTDIFSKEVIFWTDSGNSTKTFFYCSDRDSVKSCKVIGSKSYSNRELAQIKETFSKDMKSTKNKKRIATLATALFIVALVIGLLGAPALALIPLSEAVAGSMIFGGLFGSAVSSTVAAKTSIPTTAEIQLSVIDGSTIAQSNLSSLAQLLHSSMLSINHSQATSSSKKP